MHSAGSKMGRGNGVGEGVLVGVGGGSVGSGEGVSVGGGALGVAVGVAVAVGDTGSGFPQPTAKVRPTIAIAINLC